MVARTIREPASGELLSRMEVRVRLDQPDGVGIDPQYTLICKRWVKVEPLGTASYANAQQTKSGVTHRLYCRYIPDLSSSHEFVWRGRVYRVLRPTELAGRCVWSVIEVEELGPDAPVANGGGNGEFSFR